MSGDLRVMRHEGNSVQHGCYVTSRWHAKVGQHMLGGTCSKHASLEMVPCFTDSVSERLRRWTRNPLGSARRGSNPLAVDYACFIADDGAMITVMRQ